MSITIGIGKNLKVTPTPTPTANEPEVDAYILGLATELSEAQITRLNNFVYCLKNGLSISNLSDAFDVMYIFAGETQESSLRNLIKRANDATLNNAPAWVQYEGFTGNGLNANINSNYNASTQAVVYQLNNASIGAYARLNLAEDKIIMGSNSGTNYTDLVLRLTTNNFNCRINGGAVSAAVANLDSRGMFITTRIDALTNNFYLNKVHNSSVKASAAIPNNNITFLCRNGSFFSSNQISFGFAGKGLLQSDVNYISDCFEAYMDANGKGVLP